MLGKRRTEMPYQLPGYYFGNTIRNVRRTMRGMHVDIVDQWKRANARNVTQLKHGNPACAGFLAYPCTFVLLFTVCTTLYAAGLRCDGLTIQVLLEAGEHLSNVFWPSQVGHGVGNGVVIPKPK